MTTNTILLHALGTLWPENEPKPSFKVTAPYEWACYDKHHEVCGQTQEEALYHYTTLCQNSAGQIVPSSDFGPVLDFLGQFVVDPLILEDTTAVNGAQTGQKEK